MGYEQLDKLADMIVAFSREYIQSNAIQRSTAPDGGRHFLSGNIIMGSAYTDLQGQIVGSLID